MTSRPARAGSRAKNGAVSDPLRVTEHLLRPLIAELNRVLSFDRCALTLYDDHGKPLATLGSARRGPTHLRRMSRPIGQTVAPKVAITRRSVLLADAAGETQGGSLIRDRSEAGALMCVPLVHKDVLLGTLAIGSRLKDAFQGGALVRLEAMGERIALTLAHTSNVKGMRWHARELGAIAAWNAAMVAGLAERGQCIEALHDAIHEKFILVDSDHVIRMATDSAAALAGLKPDVIVGEVCHNVFARQPEPCALCPLTTTGVDQRKPTMACLYPTRINAAGIAPICTTKPEPKHGTRHAKGPHPIEVEKLKENFLAAVSHELRSPLAVIKGFVEILLAGKAGRLKPQQADFVAAIKTSTGILIKLVDDILDIARLDAGQLRLEREEIELGEMASRVERQFREFAVGSGVTLQNLVQGQLPLLHGDRRRLEQVLTNLLSNALKFTSQGGHVVVEAHERNGQVIVSVVDDGIGIPDEEKPKVFDRFYQVEGTGDRSLGGTGLGLAIARQIVEQHGGTIWVENAKGAGSQFSFTLPISRPRLAAGEADR